MNSVIDANREKTYFSIDRCPASLEASGLVKLTNFSTDKLRSMEDCDPHKTDNSSLYDSAYSTTQIEDKRLRTELGILREMLRKGELANILWVPTGEQIADALTKKGVPSFNILEHISDPNFPLSSM